MLHRSWVAALVVGFWVVTSGWLVVTKIAPTLHAGPAPGGSALVGPGGGLIPVGWTVSWNGIPIGWALTESRLAAEGGVTVDSRLHCDRLPLAEMLSGWPGALVRETLRAQRTTTSLDASGRMRFEPAGRLRSFSSTVTLPGMAETVSLEGRAADHDTFSLTLRVGELRYETTAHVPPGAFLGDELSPQATMPDLTEGRRWTVPMYSPLRPGKTPMQILHAHVGAEETIFWGDRLVNARVVAYRDDPSSPREPRCRLWVDRSGRVLRHESSLFGATMEFVRRTDDEAERLAAMAADVDSAVHEPPEESP